MYTDFVLKNPFYEVEQVIKCELFDEQVDTTVRRYPVLS
jgi:trafficking protein particle complex subunit 4